MMLQSPLDPIISAIAWLRAIASSYLTPAAIGLLPVIILVLFALLALGVGLHRDPLPFSVLGVVLAAVACLLTDSSSYPLQCYGRLYIRDVYSDFFIMIVLVVSVMVLVASRAHHQYLGCYNFMFLVSFAGAILVVMANDLIAIFVAFELMATPTYVLVALSENRGAIDGATKYFIMGLLSIALMLLGITLIYAATGETELHAVGLAVSGIWSGPIDDRTYSLLVAIVLLIVSFGFKIGIFPGWMWVPDAYGTADGSVAGYLAGASKKTGIGALVRIFMVFPVVAQLTLLGAVLAVVSVLTMTIGNVLALAERRIARMLAYSSIAMMGYLFMGLAAGTASGLAAALYTAFAHAVTKSAAFIAVWTLGAELSKTVTYDDLSGLARRSPILAACLSVLVLALAGMPFTVGFLSKFAL
ncbi:MAG: NADH-quinone oxidoreductase subunit N, partial [Candidatus Thorarchaeota archaeon]